MGLTICPCTEEGLAAAPEVMHKRSVHRFDQREPWSKRSGGTTLRAERTGLICLHPAAGMRWGKSAGLLEVTEAWVMWTSASVAPTGQWGWSQEGVPASQGSQPHRWESTGLTQGAQPQSILWRIPLWWMVVFILMLWWIPWREKMKNRMTEISMFYKNFTETNTQLASLNAFSKRTVMKLMLNSKTKFFKLFPRWTML